MRVVKEQQSVCARMLHQAGGNPAADSGCRGTGMTSVSSIEATASRFQVSNPSSGTVPAGRRGKFLALDFEKVKLCQHSERK